MTTDLFFTKAQEMECWMRDRRVFATHEVIRWGSENFYNRANRTKQDLRVKGVIRTLSDMEKMAHRYKCKDDVYVYVGGAHD